MKFSMKKLSQKGFLSLHVLLPVILVILAIGGVGAYIFVKNSHAASSLTSSGCYLRGRVWTGSSCSKTCIAGAGSHVVASPYDYCSSAISKISYSTCTGNNRKWVDNGCARRWQQSNQAAAVQCASSSMTYYVLSPYDKCSTPSKVSAPVLSPAQKCAAAGGQYTVVSTSTPACYKFTCRSPYALIKSANAKKAPATSEVTSGMTCEYYVSQPSMPGSVGYVYTKPTVTKIAV